LGTVAADPALGAAAGSDSLESIAMHVVMLDIPFVPLDPPELRSCCAALAARLAAAAGVPVPAEIRDGL
jgi:hypothetical protein